MPQHNEHKKRWLNQLHNNSAMCISTILKYDPLTVTASEMNRISVVVYIGVPKHNTHKSEWLTKTLIYLKQVSGCIRSIFNHFTSRPKSMPGSRDPGVPIVNPTGISVMYGYVTWRMMTEISVMYGSEGVNRYPWNWVTIWIKCHISRLIIYYSVYSPKFVGFPNQYKSLTDSGIILCHLLQHWSDLNSASGEGLVLDGFSFLDNE